MNYSNIFTFRLFIEKNIWYIYSSDASTGSRNSLHKQSKITWMYTFNLKSEHTEKKIECRNRYTFWDNNHIVRLVGGHYLSITFSFRHQTRSTWNENVTSSFDSNQTVKFMPKSVSFSMLSLSSSIDFLINKWNNFRLYSLRKKILFKIWNLHVIRYNSSN